MVRDDGGRLAIALSTGNLAAAGALVDMTHSSLRPMDAFDPTEPAILHDRLSDAIITWTTEEADDYRRASRPREDGTVVWKAYVFDGWGNVLGG
ncbi:hypothetical protein [Bradyrhizobium sp. 139]|uniref:hypothetical protein n=1 Tax=Bradyrhizobium sp. 139 TaxID=2782616 RepID=UPI001FF784F1|nr:hypothetical protein [Bradyrhizobium sp. 139]